MQRIPYPLWMAVCLPLLACSPSSSPPVCEGLVDVSERCVPEDCGEELWNPDRAGGLQALPQPHVYVDGSAKGAGDGSQQAPYKLLSRALRGLGGAGTLLLAAGEYSGAVEWGPSRQDLNIVGRCPELVILDGGDTSATLNVEGGSGVANGLTVRGEGMGIRVVSGSLRAKGVVIRGTSPFGVYATGAQSFVELEGVRIEHTQPPDDRDDLGRGIHLREGATLLARNLLINEASDLGVFLTGEGTHMEVLGGEIRGTHPRKDNLGGRGVSVQFGATFEFDSLLLEDNRDLGLMVAENAVVEGRGLTVRGTRASGFLGGGRGVQVQDGARLEVSGLTIEDNQSAGMLLVGPGAFGALEDVAIVGTLPDALGRFGRGIGVEESARVECQRCVLSENQDVGIYLGIWDSRARLVDTEVLDTRKGMVRGSGVGVALEGDSYLWALRLKVRRSAGPGMHIATESDVELFHPTITGNGFSGISLVGGTLKVRDGRIITSKPASADGGGVGIFARGDGEPVWLDLENVDLRGNVLASIYVRDEVDLELRGGLLGASSGIVHNNLPIHGNALVALDTAFGPNRLRLDGAAVELGGGVAVLLDASTATLLDTLWPSEGIPLKQQDCGSVSLPEVLPQMPAGARICDSSASILLPLNYSVELDSMGLELR